jgi:hypothetical protein
VLVIIIKKKKFIAEICSEILALEKYLFRVYYVYPKETPIQLNEKDIQELFKLWFSIIESNVYPSLPFRIILEHKGTLGCKGDNDLTLIFKKVIEYFSAL